MDKIHHNCKNYTPIDVIKGFCNLLKNTVNADDIACEKFYHKEMCKICKKFKSTENFKGICLAEKSNPMTYPDLVAVTCENFERK